MIASRGRALRSRGESGQATVEFALILPLVIFAALAIIQVGLVVRDHLAVVHAAREAVRAASVDPDPSSAVDAAHRTLPHADERHVGDGAVPDLDRDRLTDPRTRRDVDVGVLFPDPVLHSRAVMRVEK